MAKLDYFAAAVDGQHHKNGKGGERHQACARPLNMPVEGAGGPTGDVLEVPRVLRTAYMRCYRIDNPESTPWRAWLHWTREVGGNSVEQGNLETRVA